VCFAGAQHPAQAAAGWILAVAPTRADPAVMAPRDDPERFRHLPEPVRPEDAVETVDTASLPVPDGGEDRDRLLREAGAG
jgi:hypothetical protein